MKALIPRLDRVFIYTCNDKYSQKDLIRIRKHIKINKITGCWEYIGAPDKNGYHKFTINRNGKQIQIKAHRAAIEMATGILVPKDKCVCHKCDNPPCCNPNHLKVGSNQDNYNDMRNNGRDKKAKGEQAGNARYNWKIINKIRELDNTGKYTQQQLADKFDTIQSYISQIILNKRWYDPNYIPNKRLLKTC